jgi:CelD/BcsL family acetyltransferase involved in cellulose biosynthesis
MSSLALCEVAVPGDAEWDEALAASGRPYRFSHRAAAGRAFEAAYPSYRFEPRRVSYDDGTVMLLPLVRVRRRVGALGMALCMPLGLEGTPLVLDGEVTPAHVHGLLDALDEIGMLQVHGGAGASPPATGRVTDGLTHTLDLRPGFERLWEEAFSSKNRNVCRKADRAGVEVSEESTADGAAAYYALYATTSKGWGYAEPPYPQRLIGALVGSGTAELWLARLEGQPIAGALLLRGSQDLLYWSGALDRERQAVSPTNAVLRTAIESACARGIAYFDFGASTGLTGVEKFKASFGAQPCEYRSVELRSRAYAALEGVRAGLSAGRRP